MHVGWKNVPTAWAGQFTGNEREPTIVLKAVATKNQWIWLSFFGMPGTNNDLNILDWSPLFDGYLRKIFYGHLQDEWQDIPARLLPLWWDLSILGHLHQINSKSVGYGNETLQYLTGGCPEGHWTSVWWTWKQVAYLDGTNTHVVQRRHPLNCHVLHYFAQHDGWGGWFRYCTWINLKSTSQFLQNFTADLIQQLQLSLWLGK